MKIFRARYLLPIGSPPIEDGALLVEDDRIRAVGRYGELAAAHPGVAAVDFGDAVLLPPLVNAHTHLELTAFPDWAEFAGEAAEPADFVDWILRLVRVRRTVGEAAVSASLFEGVWKSLSAGTGAVGDILTSLASARVYRHSPLRGRIFCEVLGVDASAVAARLAEIARRLACPPAPGLHWGLSPHAPYTLNAVTFDQVAALARACRLPLAMHWAETAEEIDFLARGTGSLERLYAAAGWPAPTGPLSARIHSRQVAGRGGVLIHGVHVDADGVDEIARAGLGVILCPRSNRRFGEERAPVARYRRAEVPLALGTDSLASSPSLSVWEELAFARQWFAGALDPADWLEIATAGGAALLGLADQMGRLAAGCEANFQVVAVPAGATEATLAEALCAGDDGVRVHALFLGGENVLPAR